MGRLCSSASCSSLGSTMRYSHNFIRMRPTRHSRARRKLTTLSIVVMFMLELELVSVSVFLSSQSGTGSSLAFYLFLDQSQNPSFLSIKHYTHTSHIPNHENNLTRLKTKRMKFRLAGCVYLLLCAELVFEASFQKYCFSLKRVNTVFNIGVCRLQFLFKMVSCTESIESDHPSWPFPP